MHKEQRTIQLLLQQKLLPLYYNESSEVSLAILKALYDGGMRMVEYTNRGENAITNFNSLRKNVQKNMREMMLGIGTIKNPEQAKKFIDAGADFVICPTMNASVGTASRDAGLLWIPGCMTATEISEAEQAGASLVKLFPGNLLGPSYVKTIKEIFPALQFIPTGGVEAEENNLRKWFESGVVAVGMGSKLITREMVQQKDYDGIKKAASDALRLVRKIVG